MRDIKFRGKTINGEWVYGNLVQGNDDTGCCIIDYANHETDTYSWNEVHPDSVGEYTGLKDHNGKEIYEGDICESIGCRFKVGFKNGAFSAEYSEKSEDCFYLGNANESRFEIIGNIYQNPELLHK